MDLNERVTIETPEHVEFSYEVAGLGSRFSAGLLDALIQGTLVLVLLVLFWIGGEAIPFATFLATALQGMLLLALFLLIWGYHLYFEVFRGGQTPGKRALKIRVVAEGGFSCTLPRAAVRNLMRVVDFIPPPYGIAGVVMFLDPRGRRLGDLAAGTVVVRERGTAVPAAVRAARVPDPGARERRNALPPAVESVLRAFLRRREELTPEARERLASSVAERVAAATGMPVSGDPEVWLEAVA